ncbi:hypothetical protein, partial [Nocardia abscessus]|uniref:hypothetical protein n=1 Tax=Nocardia abscessus TaxID=120957 RepID=UPI0024569D7D
MDTVDFARVVAEFGPSSALLVEPGSSAAAHVPPRWARKPHPRLAGQQHHRAGHHPAAEHPIQLADARRTRF